MFPKQTSQKGVHFYVHPGYSILTRAQSQSVDIYRRIEDDSTIKCALLLMQDYSIFVTLLLYTRRKLDFTEGQITTKCLACINKK